MHLLLRVLTPALFAASTALAQDLPRAEITGIVRDLSGAPIDGAEVALENSSGAVVSASNGVYRLVRLPPGKQTIVVRKVGFAPARVVVNAAAGAHRVDLTLKPLVAELVTIRSRQSRVGLSGTVVDTLGEALADAIVRAYSGLPEPDTLRSHHVVRSAADGGFFIPLAPGRYTLRVSRADQTPATIIVSVPHSGGRCVVVRLGPADRRMQQAGCVSAR